MADEVKLDTAWFLRPHAGRWSAQNYAIRHWAYIVPPAAVAALILSYPSFKEAKPRPDQGNFDLCAEHLLLNAGAGAAAGLSLIHPIRIGIPCLLLGSLIFVCKSLPNFRF